MKFDTDIDKRLVVTLKAKEEMMYSLQTAFYRLGDAGVKQDDPLYIEVVKQFRRIERMLGYEKGSWGLG